MNSRTATMYHVKREIISKLKKKQNIMLLQQDKCRGIVIINRNKFLSILNTKQFRKLDRNPTKPVEAKSLRALRKIKSLLSNQEYLKIYPTGSTPGKFYGMAKQDKIPVNGTINDMSLRLIISNIGRASYQPTEYLAKLLYPLSSSEDKVANNLEFINHVKKVNIVLSLSMLNRD